jgi:hypothetical protein
LTKTRLIFIHLSKFRTFGETIIMKKLNILLVFFLTLVFSSCFKESTNIPVSHTAASGSNEPFSFKSLSASPNPVQKGKVSNLTTVATGKNLSYTWSTTHGDLFGSGSSIIYSSAPCCVGTNSVTCTVSDGQNSASITIGITVTN